MEVTIIRTKYSKKSTKILEEEDRRQMEEIKEKQKGRRYTDEEMLNLVNLARAKN